MSAKVGIVFCRICGDPEPYLERLAMLLSCNLSEKYVAVAALAEIVLRCNASLDSHAQEIVKQVAAELQYQSPDFKYLTAHHYRFVAECCSLLGQLGDAAHIPLLRAVLGCRLPDTEVGESFAEAAASATEVKNEKETISLLRCAKHNITKYGIVYFSTVWDSVIHHRTVLAV